MSEITSGCTAIVEHYRNLIERLGSKSAKALLAALVDDVEADTAPEAQLDAELDAELRDGADLMADPAKLDPFKVGDWINNGEKKYGETYDRALRETGLALSTLAGYACVARAFPPQSRSARLSFTHHAQLMGVPAAYRQGFVRELLKRDEIPTKDDLRSEIRSRYGSSQRR
jgi:hypothetical protein